MIQNKLLKNLPGYNKLYQARSDGKIFSKVTHKELVRTKIKNKKGLFVSIKKPNSNRKQFVSVAHLIGITFIDSSPNVTFKHVNGNFMDNNAKNIIVGRKYTKKNLGDNKKEVVKLIFPDYVLKFNSYSQASLFLGKQRNYLSNYLIKHHGIKNLIINNKLICKLEIN